MDTTTACITWDALPSVSVLIAGLTYRTDHDWHPEVAIVNAITRVDPEPVHVRAHDGGLYVVDGRHRVVGALLAGNTHIPAKIQSGCEASCPCH